jgi:hypothetical protein
VANAIRAQGVYFGTRGWRCENRAFWGINKDIIEAAGGSWREPPPEGALLAQGALRADRIRAVVDDYGSRSPLWGCKDPRMALTARSWLDLIERDAYLIAVFRRPEQVAASLMRKGQVLSVRDGERHARTYAMHVIGAAQEFMGV